MLAAVDVGRGVAELAAALVAAAPGHVRAVRELLFDALTGDQVAQLRTILAAVLDRLPPE